MNNFWRLLEKSTLISGVVSLLMVGTACYCVIQQIPLPEYFSLGFGLVLGWFFTSKAKDEAHARRVE